MIIVAGAAANSPAPCSINLAQRAQAQAQSVAARGRLPAARHPGPGRAWPWPDDAYVHAMRDPAASPSPVERACRIVSSVPAVTWPRRHAWPTGGILYWTTSGPTGRPLVSFCCSFRTNCTLACVLPSLGVVAKRDRSEVETSSFLAASYFL